MTFSGHDDITINIVLGLLLLLLLLPRFVMSSDGASVLELCDLPSTLLFVLFFANVSFFVKVYVCFRETHEFYHSKLNW